MSGANRRTQCYVIAMPMRDPLISGMHKITTVYNIVVELHDDGVMGVGYSIAFAEHEARSILVLAQDLLTQLGEDWTDIVGTFGRLWRAINHVGQSGPPVVALAAIDTALWDLQARRIGVPLHTLLGGGRERVPAYASGGWLSYSVDRLVTEAGEFAASGFTGYKMKVGHPEVTTDLERIRAVREAVGPSVKIMVDANQRYGRAGALIAGRRFQDAGVHWYEEPVSCFDLEGSAQIAAALDVRIATGETVFGLHGLRELATSRAADVVMPDLMRSGGITPMRSIVTYLEAEGLEVSPHLFPEISACVLAGMGIGSPLVEYLPSWWEGFFVEAPVVEESHLVLTDAPGHGLAINPDLPRWN